MDDARMFHAEHLQGLEIIGLYVLVAIAVFLVRRRIPDLLAAPVAVRIAVGVVIGLGLSIPFLVRGNNLIRDRFEPYVLIVFVLGLIGLVIWLRRGG